MSKKTFKNDNPALSYLQPVDAQEAQRAYEQKEAALKREEAGRGAQEIRNRRLQLLMTPSLHKRIEARANQEGTSVNNWIHESLEKLIEDTK